MTSCRFLVVLALAAGLALPCQARAQEMRAPDGVTLNEEGLPQYSTFSICAIDPATGQSGAGVTTRVPFVWAELITLVIFELVQPLHPTVVEPSAFFRWRLPLPAAPTPK